MNLYNTYKKKIEPFTPKDKNNVKFYTCGPTVYHYAHLGNLRNFIGHDILQRTMLFLGYNVFRCMNITDVGHLTNDSDTGDDKMVLAAKRENKTSMEIAKFYTDEFFSDFKNLNCLMPNIISSATENVDFYIKMIEVLIKKDFAYKSGPNIYFDTSKVINYNILTGQNNDDLEIGVRDDVSLDNNKRNAGDFVLWFTESKFKNHELVWDSPWGVGYPGWHIECSGISIKYLGEYLDIHGGGVDNIFPHHTNEIAQSEAYLGHKWCDFWFHNEHLLDKGGKMSKSKGDFLRLKAIVDAGYNPLSFRFMCLNSHYRKQLVFSFDALNQSEDTLKKIKNKILKLNKNTDIIYNEKVNNYLELFKKEISNDLNTANALSILYMVIKDKSINDYSKVYLIDKFDQVFGLNLLEEENDLNHDYILKKIEERIVAKNNKDYKLADSIRDELLNMGIRLIDTKDATEYERI